jgi:RNA polymerase sigma-70 factor (ECF subfamily)
MPMGRCFASRFRPIRTTPPQLSSDALGEALLSTDEEAQFWSFYRKTSEALFRKAYRVCRGHQADADDAHQRTYLRVLEHWPVVSGLADQQRDAWLARTLTREVLQIWRAPHRSREGAPHDDTGRHPAASVDDADAVFAADRYRKVCRAIVRLGGRQREVIALRCLAGYEVSEVAEMLGISPATVRVHLHAGRARLLEIMAGEEGSA